MTFPTPTTTPLDDEIVAVELLARLRAEGGQNLQFSDQPERVMGGFETQIYRFCVNAESGDLAGPLILRVFAGNGAAQAQREAAFQNALAGLGFPVPRVVLGDDGKKIGGRAYNIMELVPGRSMLADLMSPTANPLQIAKQLAQYQARLHQVPVTPVIRAVEETGMPVDSFSGQRQVDRLGRYMLLGEYEPYAPVNAWMEANRPLGGESGVVCHGDFHPGNVMIDETGVTGIIDWPGAVFADPEYDVAVTLTLILVVSGSLFPEAKPLLDSFASAFIDEYRVHATSDQGKIEYYEVLKCFDAVLRGVSPSILGIAPELLPRDGDAWAHPEALKAAAARIQEITGIALPLPDGG